MGRTHIVDMKREGESCMMGTIAWYCRVCVGVGGFCICVVRDSVDNARVKERNCVLRSLRHHKREMVVEFDL